MSGGLGDLFQSHSGIAAELDATQGLHIVFHLLGRVKGFLSDFTGRLFLDQTFVANDRLVSDRAAHVVNGAATRDKQAGGFLLGPEHFGDGAHADVGYQGHISVTEHAPLFVSLAVTIHAAMHVVTRAVRQSYVYAEERHREWLSCCRAATLVLAFRQDRRSGIRGG